MAVSEQVIDKIRKLLALAGNNPNEHEAASAAAKAQALMQEYDLETIDLSIRQDPRTAGVEESGRTVLRKAGKPGGWKIDLFMAVGKTSDVWTYTHDAHGKWYDAQGWFIGRKQDIEMADYLFAYLVREIERLQDEFGKTRWAELREYAREQGTSTHEAESVFSWQNRHPLRAKQSWIKGAVPEVIQTLYARKAERDNVSDNTRALVISKDRLIRDWYAQKRGCVDYDDYIAKMQERTREREERVVLEDKRTDAQKRRDAAKAERDARKINARWEREAQRAHEREDRRQAREFENVDWEAYDAGVKTGRKISIREGIGD